MPNSRVCFSVTDINRIVFTTPQSEILKEIRLAATVLSEDLSEAIRFYWNDRSDAYKLALNISEWYGKCLITPELTLRAQISTLRQQLYALTITKVAVRGGIKL